MFGVCTADTSTIFPPDTLIWTCTGPKNVSSVGPVTAYEPGGSVTGLGAAAFAPVTVPVSPVPAPLPATCDTSGPAGGDASPLTPMIRNVPAAVPARAINTRRTIGTSQLKRVEVDLGGWYLQRPQRGEYRPGQPGRPAHVHVAQRDVLGDPAQPGRGERLPGLRLVPPAEHVPDLEPPVRGQLVDLLAEHQVRLGVRPVDHAHAALGHGFQQRPDRGD